MILPGDMFEISFPYEDDIFKNKPRPVVILRNDGNGLFLIAPVTGTNFTGKRPGLWISKDSEEGKKMNLQKDSFIVMDKCKQWPSFGLREYWGHCPCVEELLKKLK
jgi:mRNA-degrading endonuclease toxin of MazEF toxin-antitoxin module